MNTTQVLLERIAALRQRLADGEKWAVPTSASPEVRPPVSVDPLDHLQRRVDAGTFQNTLIDGSVREFVDAEGPTREPAPAKLSARGMRLLHRGRDLLNELRSLADESTLLEPRSDALACLYHETVAMLDLVLRAASSFPNSPTAQARWCDGLETTLNVVGDRLAVLMSGLEWRRGQLDLIESLADLLDGVAREGSPRFHDFVPLAERVLDEARRGSPLRFHHEDPSRPARFVAAHSLVVAQVMARITSGEAEWQARPLEPVLAAMLHDVGMLRLQADLLALPSPLNDEQRRLVEYHPIVGAEILSKLSPGKSWLVEAAVSHHERIDGTGYPSGLRELQIPQLVRLLTVADIYAALCCPRPYRSALETRTALTDTLLLADQGALDRAEAEKLLDLSFYPVGSVVELADGATGVVVAVHSARKDLHKTSRPVLAMVTDAKGQHLPFPRHLDLAGVEGPSILRALPAAECRELLGSRYPELVA